VKELPIGDCQLPIDRSLTLTLRSNDAASGAEAGNQAPIGNRQLPIGNKWG
jgi:hypothetical protein